MHEVYLLSGSNLGDKPRFLNQARLLIEVHIGIVTKKSHIYRSAPWGFSHDEDFLNQVLLVCTDLGPEDILECILDIEKKLGRTRAEGNYEARTIDIDILLYDELIIHKDNLILPHPRMHLRRFTLEPLCEIAPDAIHPVFNKKIFELLAECEDKGQVERFS